MRAYKLAIVVALVVGALVALARAQGIGIGFGRTGDTNFRGRAETVREVGNIKTYSGNVTISFPDANVVLHADVVAFDSDAHELVIQGTARLTLDSN